MNGAAGGAHADDLGGCVPTMNRACMPVTGTYSKLFLQKIYEGTKEFRADLKEHLGIDLERDFGRFALTSPNPGGPPGLPPSYLAAQQRNANAYAGQTGFTPPPSRPLTPASVVRGPTPRRTPNAGGYDPASRRQFKPRSGQRDIMAWAPPVVALIGVLLCIVLKLGGGTDGLLGGAAFGAAAGGGSRTAGFTLRVQQGAQYMFSFFTPKKGAAPPPPGGGAAGGFGGAASSGYASAGHQAGAQAGTQAGGQAGAQAGAQTGAGQQQQQQQHGYAQGTPEAPPPPGWDASGAEQQRQGQGWGQQAGAGRGGASQAGQAEQEAGDGLNQAERARRAQQWRAAKCGTPGADKAICNALLSMGQAKASAAAAESTTHRLKTKGSPLLTAALTARGLPSVASPTSPAAAKRARLWRSAGCGTSQGNRRVCAKLLSLDEATLKAVDLRSIVKDVRSGIIGLALPPAGPQADAAMCSQALTASEARATELTAMQEHLEGVLEALTTVRTTCVGLEAQLLRAPSGAPRASLAGQHAACLRTLGEHDKQAADGTARLEALAAEAEAVAQHAQIVCEAAVEKQARDTEKAAERKDWYTTEAERLSAHAEELSRRKEVSERTAWELLQNDLEVDPPREEHELDEEDDRGGFGGGAYDTEYENEFDTDVYQAPRAERQQRAAPRGRTTAAAEEQERDDAGPRSRREPVLDPAVEHARAAAAAAEDARRAAIAAEYERAAQAGESAERRERRKSWARTALLGIAVLTVPLTGVALLSARAAERFRYGSAGADGGVSDAPESSWLRIAGDPCVDGTLMAVVRLETAAEFIFTWSRSVGREMEVIDGANAPWYKVMPEDEGFRIAVTVTSVFVDGQYGPTSTATTLSLVSFARTT